MSQNYVIANNYGNEYQRGDFQDALAVPAYSTTPVLSSMTTSPRDGLVFVRTSDDTFQFYSNGTWHSASGGGGSGTVTSVALSVPGVIFSVSGSPVTTSGTLALSLLTQTANTVLAGPTTGSATTPTFRALVAGDIPSLSAVYVPVARTLTINGTAFDLSANRNWSVGTVTSIGITAGTGISVSGSPITSSGSITVTNSAPDQTVVLTAGTGISTSGTYPNFTITNTSPSSGGTVTSITAGTGLSGGTITSSGTIAVNTSQNITTLSNLTTNGLVYVSGGTGTLASGPLSGDVTTSALVSTIAANAVTYAKMQTVSTTSKLLGSSSTTTPVQEITIGTGLTLTGTTLTATGTGGTVTTVSVASANGFAGTVSTATTTPVITLSTSITGILKGNGTAISAATAGTDYEVPLTFSTGLTRTTNTVTVNTSQNIATLSNLTTNGFVKTTGGTGALSIDTNTYLTTNQTITLSGDVSGFGTTAITTTIGALKVATGMVQANAITYAKFQQLSAQTLLGNYAATPTNVAEITIGSGLTLSVGGVLSASGSGGTVTSVTGTTNRITSTGGVAPIIDISASYVGQTSITTLGTVTTGTLSTGTILAGVTVTVGSDATGDLHYRNSGGVFTRLGVGSTGNVLTVAGGLPSWAAPAAPTSYTGLVESISFNDIGTSIGNNTYTLDFYAEYGYTINELKIISGSGTCTAAIQINGTNVTGISAVSVSTSVATGTASAANTVSTGNKVTLVLSSTSSLNNLQGTLKLTRT